MEAHEQPQCPPARWEYMTGVSMKDRDKLNLLGADGWEAVGVDQTRVLLKRPVTKSAPAHTA